MADALVGDVGGGKTTAATRIVVIARERGITVSGILSPRIMRGETRVGYRIVDARSRQSAPWLVRDHTRPDVGPFRIVAEGAALARRALTNGLQIERGILVIDEIGPLELRGGGHNWVLARLGECTAEHLLLVARREVVKHLEERWDLALQCWELDEWRALAQSYGLCR